MIFVFAVQQATAPAAAKAESSSEEESSDEDDKPQAAAAAAAADSDEEDSSDEESDEEVSLPVLKLLHDLSSRRLPAYCLDHKAGLHICVPTIALLALWCQLHLQTVLSRYLQLLYSD